MTIFRPFIVITALLLVCSQMLWAGSAEISGYKKSSIQANAFLKPQADTLSFPSLTEDQKLIVGNPGQLSPFCFEFTAATGGTGNLTYTLTMLDDGSYVTLPDSYAFNAGDLTLCRVSPLTEGIFDLQLSATDENNSTATQAYYLRIHSDSDFDSSTTLTSFSIKKNQPFSFDVPEIENPYPDYPLGESTVSIAWQSPSSTAISNPAYYGLPTENFKSGTSTYQFNGTNHTFEAKLTETGNYLVQFFGDLNGALPSNLAISFSFITVTGANTFPIFSENIADLEAVAGLSSNTYTLVNASEGDGALSYSLSLSDGSSLPDGFSFNTTSLVLTANSNILAGGDYELLYTASDEDSDNATEYFTFSVVNELVSFLPEVNSNIVIDASDQISLKPGSELNDLLLFTINASQPGDLPLSYSLVGAQSIVGLTINASTGALSGTVSNSFGLSSVQIKVTDATNDSALSSELFFVSGDSAPAFDSEESIDDIECSNGNCRSNNILPALQTPGNAITVYSLTFSNGSELGNGLSFDESSRTLSIPKWIAAGDYDFDYTVSDADADTDTLSFTLTVTPDLPIQLEAQEFYHSNRNIYLAPGEPLEDFFFFKPTEAKPGNAPYQFYIVAAFGVGVEANSSTGSISWNVPEVFPLDSNAFSLRVIDADGDEFTTGTYFFRAEARTPEFLPGSDLTCVAGEGDCIFTLPALAEQGNVLDTITLEQTDGTGLPDYISFSATDRTLTVNPASISEISNLSFTYRVEDIDGSYDEDIFQLTLRPYTVPVFDQTDLGEYQIIQGETELINLPLPLFSLESIDYSLALSNGSTLPDGISFNASSRTAWIDSVALSGGDIFNFSYTATDLLNGSDQLSFSVTILEDFMPALLTVDYYVDDQFIALEPGASINQLVLTKLDSTKVGNLPGEFTINAGTSLLGLAIDSETGVLSGTVDASFANTSFNITYTDVDGDQASLTGLSFTSQIKAPAFTNANIDLSCPANGLICTVNLDSVASSGNIFDHYSIGLDNGSELPSVFSFDNTSLQLTLDTQGLVANTSYPLHYSASDVDGDIGNQSINFTIFAYMLPILPSLDDLTIIQDQSLSFTLPAATSGTGDLTYSLAFSNGSNLPDTWSFNALNRTLTVDASGQNINASFVFDYTAFDPYSGNTSMNFSLSVLEDIPILLVEGDIYLDGTTVFLEPGKELSDMLLFSASESSPGNLPLTYSLQGGVNFGLNINSSTGSLSGLVPAQFPSTFIRIVVTDADGDTDTSSLRVFTQGALTPTFNATLDDLLCVEGEVVCNFTLPSQVGQGNVYDTIELVQSNNLPLPSAIVYNASNTSISIDISTIPTGTVYNLLYKIYDADGSGENQSFTLSVLEDSEPSLSTIDDVTILTDEQFDVSLGNSTLGNGNLLYALEQTNGDPLPAGLLFNRTDQTLALNGTLLPGESVFDLKYSVTDKDLDTDAVNFRITVITELVPALIIADFFDEQGTINLAPGSAIEALSLYTLDAANPGNAPASFSINDASSLVGLSLDNQTGVLSGTVDSDFSLTNFTLVYTDADGDTASSKALRFNPLALTPTFEEDAQDLTCLFGSIICNFSLANASQGNVFNDFSLLLSNDNELPANLDFDSNNLSLRLDPLGLAQDSVFSLSYHVEDIDGSSDTQLFTVTVVEDTQPLLGAIADVSIIQGEQLTLNLGASSLGNEQLVYSLTQTNTSPLPSELTFNSSDLTLAIDTSLLADGDVFELSYSVVDSDEDQASVSFSITVITDLSPELLLSDFFEDEGSIALQPGSMIQNLSLYSLDAANPGNAPGSFSINGGDQLIGLNLDSQTGVLSGTVDSDFSLVNFTLVYTDSDGDTASSKSLAFIPETRTPLFSQDASALECIFGNIICNFTLSNASEGNVYNQLSLVLSNGSQLPSSLSFDTNSLALSFDPVGLAQDTVFTLQYQVEDIDGSMDTQLFNITVTENTNPAFGVVQGAIVIQGESTNLALPSSMGGNGVISYALTLTNGSVLPSGLVFDEDARSLLINSSDLLGGDNFSLNYSATDIDDGVGFALLNIVILGDLLPSISAKDFSVSDKVIALEANKALQDISLFAIDSSGNAPALFSINGGLSVLGLTMNASTGAFSGTVDADFDTTDFTISLTDTDNDSSIISGYSFISQAKTPAFESTMQDVKCVFGSGTCSFTLPQVSTAGNLYDTVSLTLSDGDELSSNLNFTASNLKLVFDPAGLPASSSIALRYRVEDADGSFDEQFFSLQVVAEKIPTLATTTNKVVIDAQTQSYTLPSGIGGNGELNHNLLLAGNLPLPTGLSFNASNLNLTVISSQLDVGSTYNLLYSVSDLDNDVVSISFNVSIIADLQPSLSIDDFYMENGQISLAPGSMLDALSLVSALSVGNSPFSFSINGDLSLLGLSIDTATGSLSGLLPDSFDATSFSIELTDTDGDVASSQSYTLIAQNKAPVFTDLSEDLACGFGNSPCTYQLSNASQGNIANDFTLLLSNGSQIPESLSLDSKSLVLSFDPTGLVVDTSISLQYQVTDIDGSFDEQLFKLTINEKIGFSQNDLAYILIEQMPVNITLPQAGFGIGAITYSIDGSLPTGLSFNASGRTLTGLPTAIGKNSVSLIATDSTNIAASLLVNLSVQAQEIPNATVPSYVSGYGNQASIAIPIIDQGAGNGVLSYSFSTQGPDGQSELPAGLSFNARSAMIEGKASVPGIYTITITVSDNDNVDAANDELQLTMTLEVMQAIALSQPLLSSYAWTAFVANQYTLPSATGGTGTLSYQLIEGEQDSEQLPTGLNFDNSTLQLQGTTTQTGSFVLTYQVSDSESNSENFTLMVAVAELPAPVFTSNFADQQIRIDEAISWPALPKAEQDPAYPISYSISSDPALPQSVSFVEDSRLITGSFAQAHEYTVTYSASNLANIKVSQSFKVKVLDQGVDEALTQDILAHHALAIADSTARQVKSRMALAGKARLALEEGTSRRGRQRLKSANIAANGLVYSAYGDIYASSLDQGNEFNWQADLSVTQVGFDVSSKQWFAGVLSETVSSSVDFNHDGTQGSYDLGLGVTTLYGGYKQNKLSYWGASSSGSGGSLDLTLANSPDKQSSDLSYSALLGGLNYQLNKDLDLGGDYIFDATLKGGDAEGSASRLNAYVDWHFAQLKDDQGQVWLKPKLNGALRVDSGAADQTGIDVSISTIMKLGAQFYLDAGLRLLVLNLGGDLSETSYWISGVWQPKTAGFAASLSQRLGDTSFDRDRLLSSRLISQVEASQSEQLTLEGELSYRWLAGNSDWKLFSKGSGSHSSSLFNKDRTLSSLFSDRLGLEWTAGNGLSVSMDYRVDNQADGTAVKSSFQEQFNGYLNSSDAKLNLNASFKLP